MGASALLSCGIDRNDTGVPERTQKSRPENDRLPVAVWARTYLGTINGDSQYGDSGETGGQIVGKRQGTLRSVDRCVLW